MRKHANISDFNALETDFDKLTVEIKKVADEMFDEKGTQIPVKILKVLLLVEDTINEVTAEQKKKMSKTNSVSYNKLKQKFRKYLQSEGEDTMTFEKQLQRYRESPPPEKAPIEEEEKDKEDE